ncbi:MAG: TetR/AcrR family transcriptional regulator [Planctomycetota bacterium]|nr:TetR/AcrR family transcriptional regulator [Planctomycetota bacterium]
MKTAQPLAKAKPETANRREAILDEAIRLFSRKGYGETDLQLLANALDIGKGTLYRHFGSKEKLFLAAADRVMRRIHEHITQVTEPVADPILRIEAGIRAYFGYFAEHPESVEMLIQERALFRDRKHPTYFVHREANLDRWRALYRDLIAAGRVRDLPVEQILDTMGDMLYGAMFVGYLVGRREDPSAVAGRIISIAFEGILTDTEKTMRGTPTKPLRPARKKPS